MNAVDYNDDDDDVATRVYAHVRRRTEALSSLETKVF